MYNTFSINVYIIIEQNVQNNRAFDYYNIAKIQNNVAIMYSFIAIYCNIIVHFKIFFQYLKHEHVNSILFLNDVQFLCF